LSKRGLFLFNYLGNKVGLTGTNKPNKMSDRAIALDSKLEILMSTNDTGTE